MDIAGSEIVRFFRSQGYRYHYYGEVFAFSACSGLEDVCLSTRRRGLNEVDVATRYDKLGDRRFRNDCHHGDAVVARAPRT